MTAREELTELVKQNTHYASTTECERVADAVLAWMATATEWWRTEFQNPNPWPQNWGAAEDAVVDEVLKWARS